MVCKACSDLGLSLEAVLIDGGSLEESSLAYRRPALYDEMAADDGVVDAVAGIVTEYGAEPRTILDLGCGTGRHLAALSEQFGAAGVGVDLQQQMVDYGRGRYGADLRVDDMRSVRLGQRFELITCLGNSLAYLHATEDLMAAASTLTAHAHSGSLVVISTLTQPIIEPSTRSVRVDSESISAMVEVNTSWDPVRRLQITRRSWMHDDGSQDEDRLVRRVADTGELIGLLLQTGFADVKVRQEPGGLNTYIVAARLLS